MKKILTNKCSAFSVVEIILAASILFLLSLALISVLIYSQESAAVAGGRDRAVFLASEGLEAVRSLRDNNFANLVDGAYGLDKSGGTWALAGAADTTGDFIRTVIISTLAVDVKEITVAITWPQTSQRTGNITITSRLSAWPN